MTGRAVADWRARRIGRWLTFCYKQLPVKHQQQHMQAYEHNKTRRAAGLKCLNRLFKSEAEPQGGRPGECKQAAGPPHPKQSKPKAATLME